MLDIRYHWLTLVALFLALGLGIVIGTGLGDQGTLFREQARLAEQLEASLIRLREENQALRRSGEELARDLEAAQAIAETIARASVAGRLAGRTVFLVVPEGSGSGVAASGEGSRETAAPEAAPSEAAASKARVPEAKASEVRPPEARSPEAPAHEARAGKTSGSEATAPEATTSLASSGTGDAAARWEQLLRRAGATVVRQAMGQTDRQSGFSATAGAIALYVNPPPNVPIPDGLRAAVVWDGHGPLSSHRPDGDAGERNPGGREEGGMALPSDWLVVRAGDGAVSEWALIEGMRGGWSGYVDASGPVAALYDRLGGLVDAGGGSR